ncbi:MAG: PRTRC system protein E [Bifidobacterium dentium]
MPPFQDLFNSQEFWSAVIISLIGGGGIVGAIITAWSNRRSKSQDEHEQAEADKLAAEAAETAVHILTDSVIHSLREQVESQGAQIQHLEKKQAEQAKNLEAKQKNLEEQQKKNLEVAQKNLVVTTYTRSLFHWLQEFCEIMEPEFLAHHPKPRLPDELRPDIAPETVGKGD